jgi:hypothetical protein
VLDGMESAFFSDSKPIITAAYWSSMKAFSLSLIALVFFSQTSFAAQISGPFTLTSCAPNKAESSIKTVCTGYTTANDYQVVIVLFHDSGHVEAYETHHGTFVSKSNFWFRNGYADKWTFELNKLDDQLKPGPGYVGGYSISRVLNYEVVYNRDVGVTASGERFDAVTFKK